MGSFASTQQELSDAEHRERSFYTRENVSLQERILIGGIFLILSSAIIVLQVSLLIVFLKYSQYRRNDCYRCMTAIVIVNLVQLLAHFYGGIIVIFNYSFDSCIEGMIGATANSAFVMLMSLEFTLAINRLVIILNLDTRRLSICAIVNNWQTLLFDTLILLSMLSGVLLFTLIGTSSFKLIHFRRYEWAYSNKDAYFIERLEELAECIIFPLSLVFYIISFFVCYLKKGRLSDINLNRSEFRLLLQCFALFCCNGSLIVVWHARGTLYRSNVDNSVVCTLYWIICCAMNAIFCLIINKSVRTHTLLLWNSILCHSDAIEKENNIFLVHYRKRMISTSRTSRIGQIDNFGIRRKTLPPEGLFYRN